MGPRVAIAGGGLGGLSAALFLLRAGVSDVRVFEQQAELAEIGAGIQIAPNALRLLQRLGLGDALMAVAVPFEVPWEFRRWQDGAILFSQSLRRRRRGALRGALHRDPPRAAARRAGRRAAGRRRRAGAPRRRGVRRGRRGLGRVRGRLDRELRRADRRRRDPLRRARGAARRRVTGVHRARRLSRAGAGRGGARVRAPAGVLDLARPAAALRPLPGLRRRPDQPRDREPGRRLARGVLDRRRQRRGLRGGVLRLGRAGVRS